MILENFKYKKVLIITFGFNLAGNSATDITLRSYFREWPKDKLLILTSKNAVIPFAKTVLIKSVFLKRLKKISSKFLLNKNKGIDNRNLVPGAILNDSNNKIGIKQKVFAIGAAYIDLFSFKISSNAKKEIDEFNPELIYTIMGQIRTIKLGVTLSKKYNIPIVPHFMDDWVSTIYTGSIWLKLPRKLILSSLKKLLKHSKVGLCISDKMSKEYEIKFNKKFLPLMNTINLEDFNNKRHTNNRTNEIVFTFFGGLHLSRWKSLVMLSEVLTSLSKRINKKLRLEIYTSDDNIKKFSFKFFEDNVVFYKTINHDAVFEKMKLTNILVHVESFDESVVKFTRLSVSTKIPEYLASGTPIVAIGPSNIASIEYLVEHNCAYVVSKFDYSETNRIIYSAIRGISDKVYIKNSIELVIKNHSASQNKLFKETIMLS